MITRYRVGIGGVQLDSCLDSNATYKKYKDKIVILNIGYTAPEIQRTIETAGDADGGIITRTYRQKATVTVTFGLYIYNTADRYAVCQIIKTMASKGGTITTNDRAGQALYNTVCDQLPEIDSAKDWTAPITMVFSAYRFPYWQDTTETVRSMTGTKTSSSVTIPGNAPLTTTIAEVLVNDNFPAGSLSGGTTLMVGIYGNKINIDYQFKKNNYVLIDYDANNNIRARLYATKGASQYTSLLPWVLPSSADKLFSKPGASNSVQLEASKSVTVTFKTRGAWL